MLGTRGATTVQRRAGHATARRRFVLRPVDGAAVTSVLIGWRALLQLTYVRSMHGPVRSLAGTPRVLAGWVRWDGAWYLSIARHGYSLSGSREQPTAFFPLYPLLIRVVAHATDVSFGSAALLIAHLGAASFALLLYWLVADEWGPRAAVVAVVAALAYPSSFFLVGAYATSLLLALMAGSMVCARTNRWVSACALAALASATAAVGLVMVPVLAVMYLEERGRVSLDAMWLAVSPAGAAAYAAFLWLRFGSPLMWFTAERGWRRQIGMSSLTGFVDGFKTMLLGSAHDVRVHVYDHVVFVAFALAALALLLHRHWALGALSLLALVVPAASGELSSMNRYAIAAFGVFAWVGWKLERRPASVVVLCSMCFVMLVWITSWFIGGAFVG